MEGTQRRVWMALAMIFVIGVSSTAIASAASRYKEQITAFRGELKTQAEADTGGLAADDLLQVANWLDESEKLLAEGKTDEAGRPIFNFSQFRMKKISDAVFCK